MTSRSGPGESRADPGLSVIVSEWRQLINLACRLLGSLADAEDAGQETYTRWYAMSAQHREAIGVPRRLADHGRQLHLPGTARLGAGPAGELLGRIAPRAAARPCRAAQRPAGRHHRRPGRPVTLDESVSMAFLVILESMTPAQRVAFVLHDVFGYSFADVAGIAARTPAACRQLASSARRRIRASQPPATPPARQADLVRDFKMAWEAKDIDALIGLQDPGATVTADGAGLAIAALRPIHGDEQVARYLVDIAGRAPSLATLERRTVNGSPAWSPSTTASPWRCSGSRSQTPGSGTSGR